MTIRYIVTFEFEPRAPLTQRGTIAAFSGAASVTLEDFGGAGA